MAPGGTGPELSLVRDSVTQAQARIRLFRIAFGPLRDDQMIGAGELRGLVRDHAAQARFDLDWTPTESLPKPAVKLALLGLLCIETALPFGGKVVCTLDHAALRLVARSENPKLEHDLWSTLSSDAAWPDDLSPARVQFPLLRQTVRMQKATLTLTLDQTELDLQITAT